MTLEDFAQKLGEFIAEEIIKPLAPKPLTETREERMRAIVGGPGNLSPVNIYEETYARQAEMRVRAFLNIEKDRRK